MMKYSIIWVIIGSFSLVATSCQKKSGPQENSATLEERPVLDGHNSRNSLDWAGTYNGTLPCASCSGIETELTLGQDDSFVLKLKYLGKDDQIFEYSGPFTWNEAGSVITLEGVESGAEKYAVEENRLRALDMQGNKITSDLADIYILDKQ